jgi:hypothetical protein
MLLHHRQTYKQRLEHELLQTSITVIVTARKPTALRADDTRVALRLHVSTVNEFE